MKPSIVTLGEKEYEVYPLKLKELKALAKFAISVLVDFQSLMEADDTDLTMELFAKLIERPEEFIAYLAPNVPKEAVEDAYLEELVEAVKIAWEAQGFDSLKKLATPFSQMMATVSPTMQVGMPSTPYSSTIMEETLTITPSPSASNDSSLSGVSET